MKFARWTILLGALTAILVVGCMLAVAQSKWEVVVPHTVFNEKVRMAAFLNADFGVTGGAGDIGKARYTTDGGKTWAQADSSGG